MAGARITLEIQDGEVQAALTRLAGFAGPPLDLALRDVGEFLLIAHDQRFGAETSPDGEPWAALSPRYKRRKDRVRPGVRKLVFDNFMHGTLRYQVDRAELLFGTDRPYGATQHFGDPNRNIPARPWLGLSVTDDAEVVAIVADHLRRQAEGG